HHSVLSMQLFLAVISVPPLAVAILIRERREVENSLRESQENLKQLHERGQSLAHKLINSQQEERRRIARDLHDHVEARATPSPFLAKLPSHHRRSLGCQLNPVSDAPFVPLFLSSARHIRDPVGGENFRSSPAASGSSYS